MADSLQIVFSNWFSWMRSVDSDFKFDNKSELSQIMAWCPTGDWQAVIGINHCIVHWRTYASLALDELTGIFDYFLIRMKRQIALCVKMLSETCFDAQNNALGILQSCAKPSVLSSWGRQNTVLCNMWHLQKKSDGNQSRHTILFICHLCQHRDGYWHIVAWM